MNDRLAKEAEAEKVSGKEHARWIGNELICRKYSVSIS